MWKALQMGQTETIFSVLSFLQAFYSLLLLTQFLPRFWLFILLHQLLLLPQATQSQLHLTYELAWCYNRWPFSWLCGTEVGRSASTLLALAFSLKAPLWCVPAPDFGHHTSSWPFRRPCTAWQLHVPPALTWWRLHLGLTCLFCRPSFVCSLLCLSTCADFSSLSL